MNIKTLFAAATLVGASSAAVAHPGHEHVGVLSGMLHPLGGLEHVLVLLAVGAYLVMRWMRR